MATTSNLPGRTCFIDNKEFLYFSGTSYLGIPHNQHFRELLTEGLVAYGSNYSSSRLSNLQLSIFEEAETFLANFIETQAAVTFSSGFLAGKILMEHLKERKIIYAPNAHPALIHSSEDIYSGSFQDWVERMLIDLKKQKGSICLICNSIDPLYARPTYFSWLERLPTEKEIILVIDDSHGLGVMGEEGKGIYSTLPKIENIETIIISSLGKALGIPGGVIAGRKELVNKIKQTSTFGGSSPVVPAYLYAFLRAERVYSAARNQLTKNISYFKNLIAEYNIFNYLPGFPVFYTSEHGMYNSLYSNGILISSFPYPSPHDPLVTRIVINAMHTKDDLEGLVEEIKQVKT